MCIDEVKDPKVWITVYTLSSIGAVVIIIVLAVVIY